jgi:hypothetical protein
MWMFIAGCNTVEINYDPDIPQFAFAPEDI